MGFWRSAGAFRPMFFLRALKLSPKLSIVSGFKGVSRPGSLAFLSKVARGVDLALPRRGCDTLPEAHAHLPGSARGATNRASLPCKTHAEVAGRTRDAHILTHDLRWRTGGFHHWRRQCQR